MAAHQNWYRNIVNWRLSRKWAQDATPSRRKHPDTISDPMTDIKEAQPRIDNNAHPNGDSNPSKFKKIPRQFSLAGQQWSWAISFEGAQRRLYSRLVLAETSTTLDYEQILKGVFEPVHQFTRSTIRGAIARVADTTSTYRSHNTEC